MWDVRPLGLSGGKVEKVLDMINITANKNSMVGDKSAVSPGGIRLGTPALTTRGMKEEDMKIIAKYLLKSLEIAERVQAKSGKKLSDFVAELKYDHECVTLRAEVADYARGFGMPGI
jgi:glycine hydroxymethyltransferase